MKLNKISGEANHLFIFLFILVTIFYIINLFSVFHNLEIAENFKSLLLNYDGGFVRRGLLGEIVVSISYLFKINIKIILFFIFFISNLFFLFYFYKLINTLKKNIIFFFLVFSPLGFVYPLTNHDGVFGEYFLLREIFLLTFFLYFINLCEKKIDNNFKLIVGLVGLLLLTFVYELTIFFYPFFFIIFYLSIDEKVQNVKLYKLIIITILLISTIVLHLILYGKNDLSIFYTNIYLKLGIIINNDDWYFRNWSNKAIMDQIVFLREDFEINMFLRYFFYAHPIFFLMIFIFRFYRNKSTSFLVLISLFYASTIFIIAIDWARFLHIIYIFVLFTFVQINKKDKNKIFLKMYPSNFFNKINKKIISLFIIVYCFSWGLKTTYWQNHYSYAPIKIINKHTLIILDFFK